MVVRAMVVMIGVLPLLYALEKVKNKVLHILAR